MPTIRSRCLLIVLAIATNLALIPNATLAQLAGGLNLQFTSITSERVSLLCRAE